jgi:hypothetical protein
MYKKILFKKFSHGFHDADGKFINTGRSWSVSGVLIHDSEWSKYNFRLSGKPIPEYPTVDWSLKYRQAEILEYTQNLALMPVELQQYFENRFIFG